MSKIHYSIIAVVTNDLNSDQRMHRICTTYSDQGKNVLLLGHKKRDSLELIPRSYKQKRIRTLIQKGPIFYFEYNFRLFLIILFQKVDRYYSVDLDTLLAVGTAHLINGKPYIFDAHEYFAELPELDGKIIKKWLWTLVGQLFIPKAERRITIGSYLAEELQTKYNQAFDVVYNLPISKEPIENKKIGKKVLLYQGKVNKERGISELIIAMESLPKCELWIIGDGDIILEMKVLATKSRVGHRIKMMGWISPLDLHKYTCQAFLGLNILGTTNANYHLSAANKVYDYIMAGVPVLTMDFPEYKKLNKTFDIGYLISKISPKHLAKVISEIIDNEKIYNQKVSNCKNARNILHWEIEQRKFN
ncbi:MAG: glycosyltransferase [Saprospiraceae bacterium]